MKHVASAAQRSGTVAAIVWATLLTACSGNVAREQYFGYRSGTTSQEHAAYPTLFGGNRDANRDVILDGHRGSRRNAPPTLSQVGSSSVVNDVPQSTGHHELSRQHELSQHELSWQNPFSVNVDDVDFMPVIEPWYDNAPINSNFADISWQNDVIAARWGGHRGWRRPWGWSAWSWRRPWGWNAWSWRRPWGWNAWSWRRPRVFFNFYVNNPWDGWSNGWSNGWNPNWSNAWNAPVHSTRIVNVYTSNTPNIQCPQTNTWNAPQFIPQEPQVPQGTLRNFGQQRPYNALPRLNPNSMPPIQPHSTPTRSSQGVFTGNTPNSTESPTTTVQFGAVPAVPEGGGRFRQGVGGGSVPPAQELPRTEPRSEIRVQPVFEPRGDAPVKSPPMPKEPRFDDNRDNRERRSWQREVLARPEEVRPVQPAPEPPQKSTHGWFGGSKPASQPIAQPASQPSEKSGDLKSNEHPSGGGRIR
jgi:hypothetical protein